MAHLFTNEQLELFNKTEKELTERFTDPTYTAYEIIPVEDLSIADLTTSSENNIFDYLAIGIVCLFKEITGCEEKKIYVWNKRNYSGKKLHRHITAIQSDKCMKMLYLNLSLEILVLMYLKSVSRKIIYITYILWTFSCTMI